VMTSVGNMAYLRLETLTTPGFNILFIIFHRPALPVLFWPTARLRQIPPEKEKYEKTSSKKVWLIVLSRYLTSFFIPPRFQRVCGLFPVTVDHKFRNRSSEILFIDTRKMGTMIDRRHRELTDDDFQKVSDTYHNWRSKDGLLARGAQASKYADIKGFCKAAAIEEVEKNGFVLTPGRYVGADFVMEDDEVFEEKMTRLTKELTEQFKQSKELEQKIIENLKKVGFKI